MPIHFSADRWDAIKHDAALWWDGKLERPLIQMPSGNIDPGRPPPRLSSVGFDVLYDLSVPVEDIVDTWDYDLSCQEFHGDAFPCIWPNFGPGVLAACIGGVPRPAPDTVWFHPEKALELSELRMTYDPDNVWFMRIKDLCRAAVERWQGRVQVGMTDLGGNLDIVSTFRPGEQLLTDLFDCPDDVKRQTWEAHHLWWQHFEDINAILRPANPGYTAWTQIFSEQPYYMLQCDFCYMIGPDMFDEFVKPELVASCKRLTNPFYHLDGVGELPHLDSLLTIEELKGVQWVPGDGRLPATEWPEVYRKIRDAGKRIQIWGDMKTMDTIVSQLGSAEGLVCLAWGNPAHDAEAREFLHKYGAD